MNINTYFYWADFSLAKAEVILTICWYVSSIIVWFTLSTSISCWFSKPILISQSEWEKDTHRDCFRCEKNIEWAVKLNFPWKMVGSKRARLLRCEIWVKYNSLSSVRRNMWRWSFSLSDTEISLTEICKGEWLRIFWVPSIKWRPEAETIRILFSSSRKTLLMSSSE